MATVSTNTKTEIYTKVSGKRITAMESAVCSTIMELLIVDHGRRGSSRGGEYLTLVTEIAMTENGLMANSMVEEW